MLILVSLEQGVGVVAGVVVIINPLSISGEVNRHTHTLKHKHEGRPRHGVRTGVSQVC